MTIKRVHTGVPGMDEILYGGIPAGSTVLLTGHPGSGKSLALRQFLINALRNEVPAVLVETEENVGQVIRSMRETLGFNVVEEAKAPFVIIDCYGNAPRIEGVRIRWVKSWGKEGLQNVISALKEEEEKLLDEYGALAVGVDSIAHFYAHAPSTGRQVMAQFKRTISIDPNVVGIVITQTTQGERGFGGFGVEHEADGIVRMENDFYSGELIRDTMVYKMRDTKHSKWIHPHNIDRGGVRIEWDRKLVFRGPAARTEPLPEEVVEEMRKAVEQADYLW